MKMTWNATGDTLDIEVANTLLVDAWLPRLDPYNCFRLTLPPVDVGQDIQRLVNNLVDVNAVFSKCGLPKLADPDSDWFDQDNLNTLHRDWVKVQHKTRIVELLSKFPNDILTTFHDINNLIHDIEHSLVIKYSNSQGTPWQMVNPFAPDILEFGTWQVELDYQNLGRSTYEKWLNYDQDVDNEDTNNFTHIGGTVVFNISRPIQTSAPVSYLQWCQEKNVKPYGHKLPIGNFTCSLGTLRTVFYRNVAVANNTIVFEL